MLLRATAISAGYDHSCGIRTNKTAICWGRNFYGQPDAPSGQFTAVSAGTYRSCGIRTNKTAICWGNQEHGLADAPPGEFTAISRADPHLQHLGLATGQAASDAPCEK